MVVDKLDFPLDHTGMPDTEKLVVLMQRGSLEVCALANLNVDSVAGPTSEVSSAPSRNLEFIRSLP